MKILTDPIKFGIEQEHFIFKNGKAPEKDEMHMFFYKLNKYGFKTSEINSENNIGTVIKETKNGSVFIKNDFCTHILEIVFPPLENVSDFLSIYDETLSIIQAVLTELGIEIHYGGCLSSLPEKINLYAPNSHTSLRQELLINRQLTLHTLAHPYFFAAMCSTQVHLNIFKSNLYTCLPRLYAYDYIAILLFSNSKNFNGFLAHCVRPLLYKYNFQNDYLVNGYPEKIPASFAEYENMLATAKNLIKDYSLIIPREKFGTIEFRSNCSQNSVNEIISLIALRIALVRVAEKYEPDNQINYRFHYYKICESHSIPIELLKKDIVKIKSIMHSVPRMFSEQLENIILKLESLIT